MRQTKFERRELLTTGAAALVSLTADRLPIRFTAAEPQRKRFVHRAYLGWITDLATRADTQAHWPSMRLDEELLRDYQQSFALMRRLGFNALSVWGLYVSRFWPVDIKSAVSPARGAMVEKLIAAAHRAGLRVYSGLGVYSWGFEEIIRAHPQVSRGNPRAMCASEPEAWRWMQRVIDFVFARFPIDGVSLQSADQGRCSCAQCRVCSNAEYHALLNVRTSEYIRSRWPQKTIAINSWGMDFDNPATLPALVQMSRSVDYLIDTHDTSRRRDPQYRRKIIGALACDFGTLGGPQVEPPQHWPRDRWFLPTARRVGEHLTQLAEEGGRACEYYFHLLANPGDELSFWLAGKTLNDPATAWQKHLQDAIEELYGVTKVAARDALMEIFLEAEESWFRHLPGESCGTISMEPLVSNKPGKPVYLTEKLTLEQRAAYAKDLAAIEREAESLRAAIPRKDKMQMVIRCLKNARQDATAAR
ncbi:MAG: hypothetical protein U0Z53_30845 [Blastocatellia bacterium]